ncbi:MAG: hypothetical protein KatS3mg087_0998 [Patescibacteria group bacterium]|nr:MAG: hypothetical protein KatS3mg087_0998 [Patescibacteria group bacterium]
MKRLGLLLCTIIIFVVAWYVAQKNLEKEAEAAWLNSSWQYRQAVSVTSHSGFLNYTIEVTVNTKPLIDAGKLQSDCDDIRFTTANGITLIDHFTDFCSNSTNVNSSFFVEIPSIANGTTTVYMYYGNRRWRDF